MSYRFDNLRLEKGMYNEAGRTFTQVLEREAALGRKYLQQLKDEVVRLGGVAGLALEQETLKGIVQRLEEPELDALKKAFEVQVDKAWGVETQLPAWERQIPAEGRDGAFLI